MKKLTIFTPTYNRAYILPHLYESLCKEPTDLFIWLIVDDGSTDNTQQIVERWQSDGKVEIIYHKQPNGGKMRAHNKGVQLCTTSLFFCIDSDDQIVPDTIRKILDTHQVLIDNEFLSGIVAKKLIINQKSSQNLPDIKHSTLHGIYKAGFKGDTSLVFKTSVLKEYPFPEIEGEKFVTEGYVYDQIDQKYELLILDEYLMRCEYQEDGYTVNANSLFIKNPKGWALYFAQYYKLYAKTLRDKIKYMGYFASMCMLANTPFFIMVKNAPSTLMLLLSMPAGVKFYKRFISNRSLK